MKSTKKHCRLCGKPATNANPVGSKGNHRKCATKAMATANREVSLGHGPAYDKWLAGMAKATRKALDAAAAQGEREVG